jgi:excisionase family DNA binding protein
MRISGDGRTTTYVKIADGRLRAVKDGRRLKITYESAQEHMSALPAAQVRLSPRKTAA